MNHLNHVNHEPCEPCEPSEPCEEKDGIFHEVDLFTSKGKEVVEDIFYTENIEDVSSAKSIFDEDCSNPEDDADLFITANTETSIDTKGYGLDANLDLLE